MGISTSFRTLCCIFLAILCATAFRINDETEAIVTDKEAEIIREELQVATKKTSEKVSATPQLNVKTQSEVEVDTAEDADGALSSLTVEDTDARSKFINNRYIPDDLSNINPKPLFELLQQETNQQYLPKHLPSTYSYNNVRPSTVLCDKETSFKEGNAYKLPKPTNPPSLFSRPLKPLSKTNASNKGRNKFKTVSTSSQIVATPAANLLLKLEIGIAEPLQRIDDDDEDTVEIENSFF